MFFCPNRRHPSRFRAVSKQRLPEKVQGVLELVVVRILLLDFIRNCALAARALRGVNLRRAFQIQEWAAGYHIPGVRSRGLHGRET